MNQCDGCQRGLPIKDSDHYNVNGQIVMGCTKNRYVSPTYTGSAFKDPKITNDLIKKAMCPKAKLPGWWWKKYFAYYRGIKEVLDAMLLKDWMNGGYERHMQRMRDALNRNAFAIFDAGFKTTYVHKKNDGNKVEILKFYDSGCSCYEIGYSGEFIRNNCKIHHD